MRNGVAHAPAEKQSAAVTQRAQKLTSSFQGWPAYSHVPCYTVHWTRLASWIQTDRSLECNTKTETFLRLRRLATLPNGPQYIPMAGTGLVDVSGGHNPGRQGGSKGQPWELLQWRSKWAELPGVSRAMQTDHW